MIYKVAARDGEEKGPMGVGEERQGALTFWAARRSTISSAAREYVDKADPSELIELADEERPTLGMV